jgi:hypothetical protein
VLWGRENLLGYSVEFLLNIRSSFVLVKIPDYMGENELIKQVETIHPDVVVIYQSNYSSNTGLPMRLLQNQIWLKVILVNLENNSVEVFNKQQVWINEASDLLSIVDGCPRLPCPNE